MCVCRDYQLTQGRPPWDHWYPWWWHQISFSRCGGTRSIKIVNAWGWQHFYTGRAEEIPFQSGVCILEFELETRVFMTSVSKLREVLQACFARLKFSAHNTWIIIQWDLDTVIDLMRGIVALTSWSMSTMTHFSTDLCLKTSRAVANSPPPPINTFLGCCKHSSASQFVLVQIGQMSSRQTNIFHIQHGWMH